MDPNSNQLPRPTGPVMDVQRPRPNSAAPADNIVSMAPMPGEVIGHPPDNQGNPQPPVSPNPPAPQKKNRTGLIVAVITITVVVLIGAGVGGFIWYKSANKPEPAAAPSTSTTDRVTVEEIDTTTSSIDKTMNSLNDSADVTPNDVTDSSLGL